MPHVHTFKKDLGVVSACRLNILKQEDEWEGNNP